MCIRAMGPPADDGSGYTDRVLFTGYYTPIYDAAKQRGGEYQWPLYKLPSDLVRDEASGQVFGRRVGDGRVVPYYTRGDRDGGKIGGG